MVARRFGPAEEQELVAMYNAGWSGHALADHFQTTDITVRRTLHRAGVVLKRGQRPKPLTEAQVEEVKRLYQEGNSQEQIAKRLGTSQPKVSKALRAAGIYSRRGARFGQQHPRWKGRTVTRHGYVAVRAVPEDELAFAMANGSFYVMEHRLVMARSLGRSLTRNETVHHINGDRGDNRLENLQLRQGKHGNGAVAHCASCGSRDIVFDGLH